MSRSLLFMLALLVNLRPVAGQELPSMTLDEALAIARERSPSYLSTRTGVSVASAGVRSALGSFLPTLTANMSWNGSSNTTLSGEDDFGQTVTLPNAITVRRSTANQGLSSQVTLFDGFRNLNTLRAARHDLSAAEADVFRQELQVERDVTERFYGALRAQMLLGVEDQLLNSARESLDANNRMFRAAVANVTQVDVLGAQVDVARQEQQLERQLGEARKARLQVLEALGVLGEVIDFRPVGDFPAIFDPAALVAEEVVALALQHNPVIDQRRAEAASRSSTAAAARGSWLPSVSLNAGWGRSLFQSDFGAVFNFDPSQNRGYNFGVSVSWQAFNGFQRSQQIQQANAQNEAAQENLRLANIQLEQQVRAALIDLQNAQRTWDIQQRSTALSRQRVDLARQQYRINAIQFTSLQQIIDQAANEERALVEAAYGFAVALANLDQQVGRQVRP